jgi:hypothetical protein
VPDRLADQGQTREARMGTVTASVVGSEELAVPRRYLSRHERRWLAQCLLDGYDADRLQDRLVASGASAAAVEEEVEAIRSSPLFEAALVVARRRNKLSSLLAALAHQLAQSTIPEGVPVEQRPSPRRFFDTYYFANRPVVVKGWMDGWPALDRWTPNHFADAYGDCVIEVTAGRDGDARYEEHVDDHRREMTMGEFVARITSGPTNDVYLVAKNRLLQRPEFAPLAHDFRHPPPLDAASAQESPRLWFGGGGSVTPLHHDASNILFGQVLGRKLVRLVPAYEHENLYNDYACFSPVDLDDVDLDVFPRMRGVVVLEVVLGPGDFLLLPIGWWHWVRALEVSISLSFQNFAVPGQPAVWRYR